MKRSTPIWFRSDPHVGHPVEHHSTSRLVFSTSLLTKMEWAVATMLLDGISTRAIATAFAMTLVEVNALLDSAGEKLGVKTRVELLTQLQARRKIHPQLSRS